MRGKLLSGNKIQFNLIKLILYPLGASSKNEEEESLYRSFRPFKVMIVGLVAAPLTILYQIFHFLAKHKTTKAFNFIFIS